MNCKCNFRKKHICKTNRFPSKVYNMNLVSKEVELPGAFILGAGAVSSKTVGINGEVCIATLKPVAVFPHWNFKT